MKKINITIILSVLTLSFTAQSLSRQVIGSAGVAVQTANGGLSSTIGETVTASSTIGATQLTQGFQQMDSSNSVGLITLNNISIKAVVFPNPTVNYLKIKSDLNSVGIDVLNYTVFDISGKLLLIGKVKSQSGRITVANLASGSYILKISNVSHNFNQIIKFSKL